MYQLNPTIQTDPGFGIIFAVLPPEDLSLDERLAIERRAQPRVRLERATQVRLLAAGRRHTQWQSYSLDDGYLFDLNNIGAFVATDLVLEKGSRIEIEIAAPGTPFPLSLQAVVARYSQQQNWNHLVMPAGLGLQFVPYTVEEQRRITEIVMTTLALDLMDYGYENKRTHDFWTCVLSRIQIPASEWEPPSYDHRNTIPGIEPVQTVNFGSGIKSRFGLL